MKYKYLLAFTLLTCIFIKANGQLICPPREDVMKPFSEQDKRNFFAPSKLNYPETWFHFIDGNVEKEGITKDLEAISKAGIAGVQFFHGGNFGGSWPGVTDHVYCLSENWEDILSYTAREAKRLGLRFTMQNCPGWSMAGGPWITKENAMRKLVWTRTDIKGGTAYDSLLKLSDYDEESDYKDIVVLAFPCPKDDREDPVIPSEITCDMNQEELGKIASGENIKVKFPAEHPISIDVVFPSDTILRTIVINKANDINYDYCYELAASIKVESEDSAGLYKTILESEIPAGAWQDPSETLTFSMDEVMTKHLIITFEHKHDFYMSKLQFFSGARKNSWESEACWGLRKIPYSSENPLQDSASYVKEDSVLDISSSMDSTGNLKWNAPEGNNWIVLRIGNVNTKKMNGPAPTEATGWECDKLSPEGVDAQFDGYIGKYSDGAVKGLLNGMLLDSWECNTQTWTRGMEEKFKEIAGYDLRPWIPALFGYVIGNQETTFKFLRDWRYVINRLTVDNFYGEMARKAREKGLHIQYETSGGDVYPMDIMEYYKYADVPMAEFWHHSTTETFVGSINFKPVRPTSSAGHIYGKTRISAEAFTSGWLTWNEHLSDLKENANLNLAQGITHLVFHTYTHNPKADTYVPGTSFGSTIGTPMLRGQTWWKYMPSFTKYFARCTYMLERGLPVNDVLWYLGDDIDHKPDQRTDYMNGYNYDYCNSDVLLNRIEVRDGKLVTPEGISYKVLWFPNPEHIAPETLYRLDELVKAGAVLVTSVPKGVATLMEYDKEKFSAAWQDLYESNNPKVYLDTDIREALERENIEKDFIGAALPWNHRHVSGADWYFVAAPEGTGYTGTIDLRSSGKVEIWNPVTGTETAVPSEQAGGRTKLNIKLDRGECLFVVFNHNAAPQSVKKDLLLSSHPLNAKWQVTFPEGWGMPGTIKMDKLTPWKDLNVSEEGKSFSGTATYKTSISLMNYSYNKKYILSLGQVDMIAAVRVNGKAFEPVWTYPYSLDITSALDNGNNVIEIDVTSGWFNRLVYDAKQDESQRKTWTLHGPSKDLDYTPTGLMGPVMLNEYRK